MTAVCFPKAEIENEFPHMTLMMGGPWKAMHSNNVLKATCANDFKDSYTQKNETQSVECASGVAIHLGKNKTEVVDIYYICFSKQDWVHFNGVTKAFKRN